MKLMFVVFGFLEFLIRVPFCIVVTVGSLGFVYFGVNLEDIVTPYLWKKL